VTFLLPATYGDDVVVESAVSEMGRSSFTVHHKMFHGDQLAVEGFEKRVWTVHDPDNPGRLKSQPLPDEIRAALA
jgi:4-hydroxybenzoyl-CoA thioesterase